MDSDAAANQVSRVSPRLCGFLNLNKPRGVTSRFVVDRVKPLVRPAKIGHAGTLDPLAEGVLVVGVGPATRLISQVQAQPKTYRGTFRLGCTSDTEDVDGRLRELPHAPRPPRDALEAAAARCTGRILQTPPAYSALKVAGQRAYALARRGEAPVLAPRDVDVHELRIERYQYPELELHVCCGAGTYVRTLGRDVARCVGTDAVMTALTRTAVGAFALRDAIGLDRLDAQSLRAALQPITSALPHWPRVYVSPDAASALRQGRAVELSAASPTRLAALDGQGLLVALIERRADGRYAPTLTVPPIESARP